MLNLITEYRFKGLERQMANELLKHNKVYGTGFEEGIKEKAFLIDYIFGLDKPYKCIFNKQIKYYSRFIPQM